MEGVLLARSGRPTHRSAATTLPVQSAATEGVREAVTASVQIAWTPESATMQSLASVLPEGFRRLPPCTRSVPPEGLRCGFDLGEYDWLNGPGESAIGHVIGGMAHMRWKSAKSVFSRVNKEPQWINGWAVSTTKGMFSGGYIAVYPPLRWILIIAGGQHGNHPRGPRAPTRKRQL